MRRLSDRWCQWMCIYQFKSIKIRFSFIYVYLSLYLSLCLVFSCQNLNANELEGFAGASVTSYPKATDANDSGISVRARWNFYGGQSSSKFDRGWFISTHSRGISLLVGDFYSGYSFRWGESLYFEMGPLAFFSLIMKFGVGVHASVGWTLSSKVFGSIGLYTGNSGVFVTPQLGYRF